MDIKYETDMMILVHITGFLTIILYRYCYTLYLGYNKIGKREFSVKTLRFSLSAGFNNALSLIQCFLLLAVRGLIDNFIINLNHCKFLYQLSHIELSFSLTFCLLSSTS